MAKDQIFLIAPGFADPKRDDGPFICPYCNQIEGILASFPDLAGKVEVIRLPFARPRQPVIAAIGEAHQALPVLILPEGETRSAAKGSANGHSFATGGEAILATLAERHGLPVIHP